jgi:membrane protease YdiL (CAAX protease family)
MNPLTRLYRNSRAFRVICYLLMLLAILLAWVVSDQMWSNYTQTGNVILFLLFLFFAAWAWWYGEDRDRRQAARATQSNGATSGDGHAG